MDGATKQQKLDFPGVDSIPGIEELNLVEFPLAVLSERVPNGLKTLRFSDTIRDDSSGKIVERKTTITGSDAWGLPTWQDMDVLLALMTLTQEKNRFQSREVEFSLYELRELLRMPRSGNTNKRLVLALKRLLGLTVAYENAWRRNNKWTSLEGFHLLDNVRLTNTKDGFEEDEEQIFKWNDVVVESVQASHSKGLDWDFYLSLKLPLSKRLYRFLDKRFNLRSRWEWGLLPFCQDKLGMSRSYRPHDYKRKLQPAINELEASEFLPVVKWTPIIGPRASDR